MNDISDGLASESNEIAKASGVELVIDRDKVPTSDGLKAWAASSGKDIWKFVFNGGEDYELVFTMAPADFQALLPLTGVTFPFVSNGGSAMMSAWGLLAFLKATDTRENASFAIRRGPGRELTEEARLRAEPVGDPFAEKEESHEED